MPALERLYLRSPVWAQEAACHIEGWNTRRKRYGGDYRQMFAAAEQRVHWSQSRMLEFRDGRLASFVRHAANTVPSYRSRFRALAIDPGGIRHLDDLGRLPILTKAEVQLEPSGYLSSSVAAARCNTAHTSGTTGGGLQLAISDQALREQWAVWWRYRHWHGLDMDTPCGYFAGRNIVPITQREPPFWRHSAPLRQILFSGYHMRPDTMPAYVEALRRARPPWLHGYPSLLSVLAAYLVDREVDLGYQIRWVTTGAENLLQQQANLMTRAFGVRPVQHYGMCEGVANFSECERGRLHVDEDFAAVEFVPVGDGITYRVVGTNFSNLATELIRYDAQDLVTLSRTECSCGKPGRIVETVDGRHEDYVVLEDGTRVGRLDHIFKDFVKIREAQIRQSKPGEITIRIVRGESYTADDERRLLASARQRIGNTVHIHVQYLDRLERTRNGKLRFVVSDMEQGRLDRVTSK